MKKLIVPVMLGLIILIPFAVNFTITPEAAAMSLDDEDEDMEDFENYIQKAEKAADSENFSKAKKYLKKAAKFGIGKKQLKKARNYLSKKRKARKNRLARQERERASSSSNSGSSGGSSSGTCVNNAFLMFDYLDRDSCRETMHIHITSKPAQIYDYNINCDCAGSCACSIFTSKICIRGSYSFTFTSNTSNTSKIEWGCNKWASYSGSFYLDGTHKDYRINFGSGFLEVIGY